MALPTSGSIASLSSWLTANLSTPPTLVIHYYRHLGFGIWGEENVQKDFIQLFYSGRYVEGSIASLCSLLADPLSTSSTFVIECIEVASVIDGRGSRMLAVGL